jgi:hypothetical protein
MLSLFFKLHQLASRAINFSPGDYTLAAYAAPIFFMMPKVFHRPVLQTLIFFWCMSMLVDAWLLYKRCITVACQVQFDNSCPRQTE